MTDMPTTQPAPVLPFVAGDPHDCRECEQHVYLDPPDGLVHRIDVVSSGAHRSGPVHQHEGAGR